MCDDDGTVWTHAGDTSSWRRLGPPIGDASSRRYSRVQRRDGATAMLCEYPPGARVDLARDVEVLQWCADNQLRVPKIHAANVGCGWVLLEDLGELDGEWHLRSTSADDRAELVEEMIAPLKQLATCAPESLPKWSSPLDERRMRWELTGFEMWFLSHHRRRTPPSAISRWFDSLAREIAGHPRRVCHRDYHLNNIFLDRAGAVATIDIQDILVGPDTYDLASLIGERAAVELLTEEDRDRVATHWARHTNAPQGWQRRLVLVRIQRSLKVVGTFTRFSAGGLTQYEPWRDALLPPLAQLVDDVGGPSQLTATLVD